MVPVAEIQLKDFRSDIHIVCDDKYMNHNFTASASFYNPNVTNWEPIIEKVGMEVQHNQLHESPYDSIVVKSHRDTDCVNIDFSEQMVLTRQ